MEDKLDVFLAAGAEVGSDQRSLINVFGADRAVREKGFREKSGPCVSSRCRGSIVFVFSHGQRIRCSHVFTKKTLCEKRAVRQQQLPWLDSFCALTRTTSAFSKKMLSEDALRGVISTANRQRKFLINEHGYSEEEAVKSPR